MIQKLMSDALLISNVYRDRCQKVTVPESAKFGPADWNFSEPQDMRMKDQPFKLPQISENPIWLQTKQLDTYTIFSLVLYQKYVSKIQNLFVTDSAVGTPKIKLYLDFLTRQSKNHKL